MQRPPYPRCVRARNILPILAGLAALAAPAAHAESTCSLYASPTGSDSSPGTSSSPFRTAQHLISVLTAGQTGCLNAGVYAAGTYGVNGLVFPHGSVTLESTPGQTQATISGGDYFVYIPSGSSYVTVRNLRLNLTSGLARPQTSVQIMAAHDSLTGDDITNGNSHATCISLGSNAGYGQATGTIIQGSTIHQCGAISDGNQDHAIYFENSSGAQVTGNTFWGTSGFAVHLYPNAQGNLVEHNVIDNSRYGGVIFAGDSTYASSQNTVDYNVITNDPSGGDPAVSSWWEAAVGWGNQASRNCLWSNASGNVSTAGGGFTATGNVVANPEYVNRAAHDYRLAAGSPCLPVVGWAP